MLYATCQATWATSQAINESELLVGVAGVVTSLPLDVFWRHLRQRLPLVAVDSGQGEAVSDVAHERGDGDAQRNEEGRAVVWPVLGVVHLGSDDTCKVSKAVDAQDQCSLARF